jgi:transposase
MKRALSASERGFVPSDRSRLRKALTATDDARLFRRIQTVLLVASGSSCAEAAAITSLSRRTAYHLVRRYLQEGHSVQALHERTHPGRPLVAAKITRQRILDELERSPLQLGYRSNVWTVKLLAEHLSHRYRCPISQRTLRRRMKEIGLRCKRPRYFYSEKEPHLAQKKGLLSGV